MYNMKEVFDKIETMFKENGLDVVRTQEDELKVKRGDYTSLSLIKADDSEDTIIVYGKDLKALYLLRNEMGLYVKNIPGQERQIRL